MADRVYPNNKEVDMGSKIEFNGIDWATVENNIQNNRFAQDNTAEIINMIQQLTGVSQDDIQGVLNEATEKFGTENDVDAFDSTSMENPSFEEGINGGIDGGMRADAVASSSSNTKTAKTKKIAFTHPSQISAEAIEKALADGDQKLANTILAARKENRIRIAKAIESSMDKPKSNTKTSQVESVWVKTFSGQPEKLKEAIVAMKASGINTADAEVALAELQPSQVSTTTNMGEPMKFASPNEFTKAQRLAFNQVATSLGMPKEYIEAMISKPISPDVEALSSKLKEVISSNISNETKTSVIKNLIKEAKLSSDSKSEFVDYWNNVLGYQDKEFWPSVAEEYSEKGK